MDRALPNPTQLLLLELRPQLDTPLGRRLSVLENNGQRAVFLGATAIHVHDAQDRAAEAAAIASLAHAGVVTRAENWRKHCD